MSKDMRETQQMVMRNISSTVDDLDRALEGVITRAVTARNALRAGQRATSPGFTLLGREADDVERYAAALETLLTVASAALEPEDVERAYRHQFEPWRP